jgi:hypothetical protein
LYRAAVDEAPKAVALGDAAHSKAKRCALLWSAGVVSELEYADAMNATYPQLPPFNRRGLRSTQPA